ncbi:DUF4910 domain-containing protein [Campylobacter cuniculorum]|uniref:Putative Zn-peptidase, M28 family (DUF4910 domain) n=1 Tax=Campylobacter cuniculorum DSM 23162 = LMG 24588 TaxID=1121267 RepID=A0A1W6BW09_9BACT|nr:DUF4910 domain-containing protein [Campylobacter cuniculorum]ARJ56245.1 putative Zn-peptidase, M28 family (DUF4910 domain) [Campylobacter cuniculorum DSM 23162 = LMG 24588]
MENFQQDTLGQMMHNLAQKLFPICRSISGEGFRKSLKILDNALCGGGGIIRIHSIKSGSKVFDWTVPSEWNVKDAYIITPNGKKICDFKKHNLHLLGYSQAVDQEISLEELQEHLYSRSDMPDVIPYYTSYYKQRWGFCLSHNERLKLKSGIYKVFIDSTHDKKGVLNYADFIIPATQKTNDEILISSYLCHPSMANNELSGPIVAVFLAKWLLEQKSRKYNYRFVLIPETIGSLVYLSKNLKTLKAHVKAGFVLSCIGDECAYSLIHTPSTISLSDRVALHTLKNKANFKEYSFLHRGSDERQYNAPLVNLDIVGICRSKYGEFKEYHTSKDDLNFVTPKGLAGGLQACKELILNLEINEIYQSTTFGEPNLGKRGLYPTLNLENKRPLITDFLAYCDGQKDVLEIADILGVQGYELQECIEKLLTFDLIKKIQ